MWQENGFASVFKVNAKLAECLLPRDSWLAVVKLAGSLGAGDGVEEAEVKLNFPFWAACYLTLVLMPEAYAESVFPVTTWPQTAASETTPSLDKRAEMIEHTKRMHKIILESQRRRKAAGTPGEQSVNDPPLTPERAKELEKTEEQMRNLIRREDDRLQSFDPGTSGSDRKERIKAHNERVRLLIKQHQLRRNMDPLTTAVISSQ